MCAAVLLVPTCNVQHLNQHSDNQTVVRLALYYNLLLYGGFVFNKIVDLGEHIDKAFLDCLPLDTSEAEEL